ncbi:MAG: anthranilate phosphoribosyltransferase [archaeon]|nr:anthranilate phosphoribosyltransferase [archaeon]
MVFNTKDGLNLLVSGSSLTLEQSQDVMKDIMSGNANDAQIAGFLTALRMRGETPEIIAGCASIMREFAASINPVAKNKRLVDTCGTGGDKSNTFNISTIAALVSAGAGAVIAKHGNRSVSSSCGSADLLEGLGVNITLSPEEVEKVISSIGIGFMFAPKFHPAMKYVMPARKGLAMRTIFNILGPLTNPAGAKAHVLGVFEKDLVEVLAKVMSELGSEHVYIVHSEPGVDEILPISNVFIGEVTEGEVKTYTLTPKDFGIENLSLDDVKGGTLEENLKITADILTNRDKGIKRKVVIINAAYAIIAAGLAKDFQSACELAEKSLNEGSALKKLKELVNETKGSEEILNKVIQQ